MELAVRVLGPLVVVVGLGGAAKAGLDSFHFSPTDYALWEAAAAKPLLYGSLATVALAVVALVVQRTSTEAALALLAVALVVMGVGLLRHNAARNPWGSLHAYLDDLGSPPAATTVGTVDLREDLEVPASYRLFTTTAPPPEACASMRQRIEQRTDRVNLVPPDDARRRGVECALEAFAGKRRVHLRVARTLEALKGDLHPVGDHPLNRLRPTKGPVVLVDVAAR